LKFRKINKGGTVPKTFFQGAKIFNFFAPKKKGCRTGQIDEKITVDLSD
jgi:hypothetical protein